MRSSASMGSAGSGHGTRAAPWLLISKSQGDATSHEFGTHQPASLQFEERNRPGAITMPTSSLP